MSTFGKSAYFWAPKNNTLSALIKMCMYQNKILMVSLQAIWICQAGGFMTKFARKLIKFDLRKLISGGLWCKRKIAIFSLRRQIAADWQHWTSLSGASLVRILKTASARQNLRNLDWPRYHLLLRNLRPFHDIHQLRILRWNGASFHLHQHPTSHWMFWGLWLWYMLPEKHWGASGGYLRDILGISCGYLGDIMGDICGISWE